MHSTKSTLESTINLRKDLIEEYLINYLDRLDNNLISQAIKYSVLGGGKRLRGILTYLTYESLINRTYLSKDSPVLGLCAAIEMLQAMSLIHDDLPCMDNDDYRRGKLTNHKVYGEGMALLAGDALIVLANETIIHCLTEKTKPAIILNILQNFNQAIGLNGMIGGQALDIAYSKNSLNQPPIEQIHKLKTGAFFGFATWSGAYLATESSEQASVYKKFGELLGLAFQIADDLLDATHSLDQLGKSPGKDQLNDKLTYVTLYGIDKTQEALSKIQQQCLNLLHQQNSEFNPTFEYIIDKAINRHQ